MYLTVAHASEEFRQKPPAIQDLINQALVILHALGVPLHTMTARRLERMALAFLAVADVKTPEDWPNLQDRNHHRSLRTRDIIGYINTHFAETISMGSYDDIRRKDLVLPVAAGIIVQTSPDTARNNSLRGYAIDPTFAEVIRTFQPGHWEAPKRFMEQRTTIAQMLQPTRDIRKTTVQLPTGITIELSPGEHNRLQKAIIEEFLPRYGYQAQVLYVGDTAKKFIIFEKDQLESLRFFELAHGELPDIIAYSPEKNWLYLIEAVHTSGSISPLRLHKLKSLTQFCTAAIIYVTAFLDRETFRRFIGEIAWETEVWIASDPDHLIHFDGDKFLGPYYPER